MFHFSTQRLLLILSTIGTAAFLLYINTIVNPIYNKDSFTLFVAIICLSVATYTLSGFLGINRRIKQLEEEKWQAEFREENKKEIESMARQIRFNESLKVTPSQEETELQKFDQNMKVAEGKWKDKKKNERNLFELYFAKEHTLRVLKKVLDVWSVVVLVYTAFYTLNISISNIPFAVLYLTFLAVFITLTIIVNKKNKQLQNLRLELYPKVLNDLIKIVEE